MDAQLRSTAAPRAWEAIPAALQASVEDGALAGLVTLAWHRGEVAQLNTVGFANIAAGAPMRRDTIFRIASMTKPVTSLAALMLVEEGKLGLDDPITRWMPEFAGLQVLDDPAGPISQTTTAPREITVEDLMSHRSGFAYAFTAAPALSRAYSERLGGGLSSPLGVDEWLAALASLPLTYPPGDRFHYGHSTDVLGFLLARIEGMPLGEVLKARVLDPLGIGDTAFWVPPQERGRLAALYRALPPAKGGGLKDVSPPVRDIPPAPGAFESGGGGLFSTVDDYLTFARLLLGRGEADGVRLVRPETVDLMTANRLTAQQRAVPAFGMPFWASQGFGLGLSVITDPDKHQLMGAGAAGAFGWPGAFGTWWQADPANEVVLVYLIQDAMDLTSEAVTAGPQRPAGRMVLPAFQKLTYQALER
jgi:CubicO group peptidase (beta-lactamase class C family)